MKMKLRPLDIVLFFILITSGIILTVSSMSKSAQKGERISVIANGIKYEYSASKNGIYTVEGELGPTSFEIKDGRVRIIDSPCPNKTCINQGWHNPLVCLPNKVMIRVEEENGVKGGRFDAISE